MIFTTAGRPTENSIQEAMRLAQLYNGTYISRQKRSIQQLLEVGKKPVIVTGIDRLYLYTDSSIEPVFFHPNSAMFRCKSLLNGHHDAFIDVSGLTEGMCMLDCTAGLGSDSIVASFVTGVNGGVEAVEGSKHAILLQEGLKTWESHNELINAAMRRVSIKRKRFEEVLPYLPDNSVDIVYFDPMFEDAIPDSHGVSVIKQVALYDSLTEEMINEAKRVARKRVLLKDFWKSSRFDRHGFVQQKRKTAKFHYGTFEC
ncbi:class I SAM-dependent methyltransferase [Pseudalkalibacillus hwajinpoensis]|uniref:class I SAM-dependent methyltransferase n=1 Tax=Guptibacillus hwajinpoensis TaxID=208199 RepID=UPI00325B28EA